MPLWKKKKAKSRQAPPQESSLEQHASVSDPSTFLKQATELIPAEVRMISGCHSEQTSADLRNVHTVANQLPNPAGRAGGACTSALLDILYKDGWPYAGNDKILTFQDLLLKLRDSLARSGLSQTPQLTSSRPMDVKETPFHLVGGTGRRRALLVGINYRGQNGELSGCHNDVKNVKKYIMETHGFPEQDVTMLVDDNFQSNPTRGKIITELRRLVSVSIPGDSVYFHYSGHGGLLSPDFNVFKGKSKEYDETLIPLDYKHAGEIRDFSLFNHFVKPMKAGVTVTCVIDACHSGSVLDLPYSFRPTAGGGIQMRSSMGNLSNLAFLYILAGGMLPHGLFHGVTENIEDTVGGDVDAYQGTGLEEAEADGAAFGENEFDSETPNDDTGFGDDGPGDMNGPGLDGDAPGDMNGPGLDGDAPGDMNGPADLGGPGFDGPGDMNGPAGMGGPGDMNGPADMGGPGLDGGGPPLVVPGEPVANDFGGEGFENAVPVEGPTIDDAGFGGETYGNPYGDGFDGGDEGCDGCGDCVADVLGSLLENE